MATSATVLRHWLSIRVRTLCIALFIFGSLLPPYVPRTALALEETSAVEQQFLLVEDGFLMKSSMLTSYGARRAYTTGRIHIVKDGESIEKLANRYDIDPNTIRWANDLEKGSTIFPGDELIILPVDGVLHTVSRGETLSRIAEIYETKSAEIMKRNDLKSEFILAGQELIIPGASPIIGEPVQIASAQQPIVIAPKTPTVTSVSEPVEQVVAVSAATTEIALADITEGVLQKPCSSECFVTQYYHNGHYALDMQERGGGNVYASEAGTVIRADTGWNGGYGNVIEIDHGNGLVTLYAHNKKFYVQEGDRVQRGTKIADMGNTGLVYGQTGIHVHFEVRLKGVKKNPLLYVQ